MPEINKEEAQSGWAPVDTGAPTLNTETHYYDGSSPQHEYTQQGGNTIGQTLKELVSPKFTHDPETHFNNLISHDPGYTQDYEQGDKTSIWQTIKELISPKSTYDPGTHFETPAFDFQLDLKVIFNYRQDDPQQLQINY